MRTATLAFEQLNTSAGTLNAATLATTSSHYDVAEPIRYEFLHVEDSEVAEPRVLDGYMFGFLHFAMQHVDLLRVAGPVSSRAMRNARVLMEARRCVAPDRYRVIDIAAETVVGDDVSNGQVASPDSERAIAAFSGGADATFLALRHATGALGIASYDLRDVVMVHGFDVRIDNAADFDGLFRRTQPLLHELGLTLHVVKTNVRTREIQDWQQAHGALLACVLHQFSSAFRYGLVGSSYPYSHPIPSWGSTPATDYLLSGAGFDIVHEGAGYSRSAKMALIASNPTARRALKVCWAGAQQDRNCGTCEKCVRTRLNFLAAGHADPECFDTPFDLRMIRDLTVSTEGQLVSLRSVVEYAESAGCSDAWVPELRRRVCELDAALSTSARPGSDGPEAIRTRGGSSRSARSLLGLSSGLGRFRSGNRA